MKIMKGGRKDKFWAVLLWKIGIDRSCVRDKKPQLAPNEAFLSFVATGSMICSNFFVWSYQSLKLL